MPRHDTLLHHVSGSGGGGVMVELWGGISHPTADVNELHRPAWSVVSAFTTYIYYICRHAIAGALAVQAGSVQLGDSWEQLILDHLHTALHFTTPHQCKVCTHWCSCVLVL